MNEFRTLLITGGTGFVGRHFIYRLLQSGMRVVALARGDGGETTRRRLVTAVNAAAQSYGEVLGPRALNRSLFVESGDITLPFCGLGQAARDRWKGQIHEFWHIAASLRFEDEFREEIYLHNVRGTQGALELADVLGIPKFNYFSTAYTCGRRAGSIEEAAVPAGVSHNNYYEVTKAAAEAMVARECEAAGVEWSVLRPSIVVGPSSTHCTGGSSTGMYGFVREVQRLREVLSDHRGVIRISGRGEIPLDLVPIDSVVTDMLELVQAATRHQRFYHLTNPEPPRLIDVVHSICDTVGVPRFELIPGYEPGNRVEQAIDNQMGFYRSYFREYRSFQRRLPRRVVIGTPDIRAYTRAFLNEPAQSVPLLRSPASISA